MRMPRLDLGLSVTSTTDVAWLRCWKGSWDPRCVLEVDDLEGQEWPSHCDKETGRRSPKESLDWRWWSSDIWRLWAYTTRLSWYASIITRQLALGYDLKLKGSQYWHSAGDDKADVVLRKTKIQSILVFGQFIYKYRGSFKAPLELETLLQKS